MGEQPTAAPREGERRITKATPSPWEEKGELPMKPMMRILALALGLVLALSGCQKIKAMTVDHKARVKEALARPYSFDAEITYSGTTVLGQVEKTEEADLQIAFTEPAAFKGLVIAVQGEEVRAEYLGIQLDLSTFEVPTQAIPTLVREVLTGEQLDNMAVKVVEDTVVASGSIIIAAYEIVFDKETMAIRSISVPTADAQLVATNFTFTDTGK